MVLQTVEQVRYPITISTTRSPILTQIMADFQLSQEAWKKIRSQRNEMAETNKLLKKAVKSTYKILTTVPQQYPKKTPNNMKTSKKTKNTFKFIENPTKDNKDVNKNPKRRNDSNNSKENITSKTNTVSEILVSDSDQRMDIEDNDNDSLVWRSLPDIATTFEDRWDRMTR